MKKQTAVEWLIDELNGYDEDCEIFRIAKAMEKEQIIDARKDGVGITLKGYTIGHEEYYNKRYGGDK